MERPPNHSKKSSFSSVVALLLSLLLLVGTIVPLFLVHGGPCGAVDRELLDLVGPGIRDQLRVGPGARLRRTIEEDELGRLVDTNPTPVVAAMVAVR